jgi:hypothetical protein
MARKEAVMIPEIIPISSQLAAYYTEPSCDNLEEYAQRHGRVSRLPILRDRIYLRAGTLLIIVGEKLTEISLKHMQLSEELT